MGVRVSAVQAPHPSHGLSCIALVALAGSLLLVAKNFNFIPSEPPAPLHSDTWSRSAQQAAAAPLVLPSSVSLLDRLPSSALPLPVQPVQPVQPASAPAQAAPLLDRLPSSAALPLPVQPPVLPASAPAPGGAPRCRSEGTQSAAGARFTGLPDCLETGTQYTAALEGMRACAGGGDYWEILLMGPQYLGRAPSADLGNGSHAVAIFLPHLTGGLLAAGGYRLFAHLLFEGGAGLGGPGVDWKEEKMLGLEDGVTLHIEFKGPGECSGGRPAAAAAAPDAPCALALLPSAPPPTPWHGFWLRSAGDLTLPCAPPFCAPGSAPIAAAMADNAEGWVYRLPHCAFALVPAARARACMRGSHLLALGDSTMQDSVRNYFTDGLGVAGALFMEDGQFLPRSANFTRRTFPGSAGAPALPAAENMSLTLAFAGAPSVKHGGAGVRTYADAQWAAALRARVAELPPTHLWVNDAGLHSAQWVGDAGVGGLAALREVVRERVLPLWLAEGPAHVVYRTVRVLCGGPLRAPKRALRVCVSTVKPLAPTQALTSPPLSASPPSPPPRRMCALRWSTGATRATLRAWRLTMPLSWRSCMLRCRQRLQGGARQPGGG